MSDDRINVDLKEIGLKIYLKKKLRHKNLKRWKGPMNVEFRSLIAKSLRYKIACEDQQRGNKTKLEGSRARIHKKD